MRAIVRLKVHRRRLGLQRPRGPGTNWGEMFTLAEGSLYARSLDLWIDSMASRDRCYVSHGHSDHAREHATVVATVNSARVCRLRFGRKTERSRQTSLLPE